MRPYTPADAPALIALGRAAVRELAPAAYTPAQVEAWGSFPDDAEAFARALLDGTTLVIDADAPGELAAFAQLEPSGRIALLYTHPRHARRGHATALLAELERTARTLGIPRLHAEASHLSRPVFERAGFRVLERRTIERRGVPIEHWIVAKDLVPGDAEA